jgi:hypothetical protein
MYKLVAPVAVEVIGEHKLRVTFKDGLVGDIDFAGRHWRRVSALAEMGMRAEGECLPASVADPAFFAQAYIAPEIRTVAWPNGFDMAPETLYEKACANRVTDPDHVAA